MRFLLAIGVGMILVGSGSSAWGGQPYCVSCVGPEQSYACFVETPPGLQAKQSLQLYCVFQLARQGGHQSCSVKRSSGGNCQGIETVLSYSGPSEPAPQPSDFETATASEGEPYMEPAATDPGVADSARPPAAGEPEHQPPEQEKKSGEPRTLIEATERAVDSSGEQLGKAGKAVKNAGATVGDVASKATKTVVDATKDAAKSVSDVTTKAGKAVGKAAKSAYDCVTSLFSKCD